MARAPTPTIDMSLDEIMRRWPRTVEVLIRHQMLCVGCPISGFHTPVEACEEHGLDGDAFMRELIEAACSQAAR